MMNLHDMKLGDVLQLLSALNGGQTKQPHPMVGKHVILRCQSAGVHAGVLVSQDGDQAVLKNARRLWYWKANDGIALSGVAKYGLHKESKVDARIDEIALTGVIETIPTTKVAEETINNANKK
jgi:hypothetical protein